MSDRVEVAEYGDLAARTDLSRREIDTLLAKLNESDARYLAVEEWLIDEKPIEPMADGSRLFRLTYLLDETAKAWRVRVGDEECWMPKSQSLLVERAGGVEEISSPTKTLSDYGSDGGRA